jgi:hypothetical protein
MKSSMTKTSHTGMIIEMRDSIWPLRKNYNHMKYPCRKVDTQGDDYLGHSLPSGRRAPACRQASVTIEKQIIII